MTNLFLVGSRSGYARSIVKSLPVTYTHGQHILQSVRERSTTPSILPSIPILFARKSSWGPTLLPSSNPLPTLRQDIHQENPKVPSAATLSGPQKRQGATIQEIDSSIPILRFHIAGSDDTELLMGFVELALGDPAGKLLVKVAVRCCGLQNAGCNGDGKGGRNGGEREEYKENQVLLFLLAGNGLLYLDGRHENSSCRGKL